MSSLERASLSHQYPKDLKDLKAAIREFSSQPSRSPTSSESTTPDASFTYISSSGASSNSSSGSLPSTTATSSSSLVESTLSSACSSLTAFAKSGRLHSICEREVDHSSNNNSIHSSTLSSPDVEQPIIQCNSIPSRALSASPS